MRVFFLICLLLFCPAANAQENMLDNGPSPPPTSNVPQISFAQQVDIVVTAKKNPMLLELKIKQDEDLVLLDAIVDKGTTRAQAVALAQYLIILTKVTSIDDKPREKGVPGKGLYDYRVTVALPDGVLLITAMKPKKEDRIDFEDQYAPEPLTRADATGR